MRERALTGPGVPVRRRRSVVQGGLSEQRIEAGRELAEGVGGIVLRHGSLNCSRKALAGSPWNR